MRIKEEFKKSGYFWLPSTPGKKIPGTLVIRDGGYIELEVVGQFDEIIEEPNRDLTGMDKLERIIGDIENHSLVTLDECCYANKNIFSGSIFKSSIYVSRAFIGVAYDDKEIVSFNSFQFSVEGIDEWVGISGITVEYQFQKQIASIKYSHPEEILLNLNNEMKLFITYSFSLPGLHQNLKEARITQKTYFKLVSEHQRPLTDFMTAAYKITNLLGFAIDETVCIDHVSVTSNVFRQNIGDGKTEPIPISLYYRSLPYTKIEPKTHWQWMLFRFEQIREDAERIINNWFVAYDQIVPALNLYFSTTTGAHKFVESKFLTLAQGLETYHRRTSKDCLMDENVFKELTENLIKKCPKENQEWLSGRLRHGNELNLCRRIKSIIEPFKEHIGTDKERKKLIRTIVDTRNYLTHYEESLESKAVRGKELALLCHKMEAIFQLHLLQLLGFSETEIKSVINNSGKLRHKLK